MKFDGLTDREVLDLRTATNRERMDAHFSHNNYKRKSAAEKLRAIDKEIARRREINRSNRGRSSAGRAALKDN